MPSHDRRTHIPLRVVLAGAIGLLAVACSSGPAEPTGTVTYWIGDDATGPEFKALTEELIPAFEAGHLWLDVEARLIPSDQLQDQLRSAIADGTEPDVVAVDISQVAEFANEGALLPLDTEMSDFGALSGSVYKGSLATNMWEGHYYGLPLETNTQLLVVNRQALQVSGLRMPMTMQELEFAMTLYRDFVGGFTYSFASDGTDARNVLPWIWAFGGSITDPNGTVASGYLNGPGTVRAVSKLNEWLHLGYLSPSMIGQGPPAIDQLDSGQAASMFGDASLPPMMTARSPGFAIIAAPVPGEQRGGVSLLGGKDIVVSSKTNAKVAALAFVRSMLSEQAQLAFAKSGKMPAITSLVGRGELPAYLAPFVGQLDNAMAPAPSAQWAKIDDTITEAVRSALEGKSIDAALNQAAETVDQLLLQQ
jgi:multiple sugar transport system substrate-binding protein